MIENKKIPQVLETWPIPIGMYYFERDFTEEEKAAALEMCETLVQNEGNSHTERVDVLDHPQFAEIKQFCISSVNSYFKYILNSLEGVEPYITISWINVSEKGQSHHKHTHPNSIVSGVLYLNANAEQDSIMMFKPEYRRLHYCNYNTNKYNTDTFSIPVHTGDLILFDSNIEHAVLPTQGDHIRMSLSFNTFIKGTIGTAKTLTKLDLKGE